MLAQRRPRRSRLRSLIRDLIQFSILMVVCYDVLIDRGCQNQNVLGDLQSITRSLFVGRESRLSMFIRWLWGLLLLFKVSSSRGLWPGLDQRCCAGGVLWP
ncbi:hypothetical protein PIB30_039801 [Stylosanthes scabra]|uniref:Uncharacterized protein n=1 Tax=Stylosanthes scabra TaxID=79078 RepID=A0ABU6YCT9_9FABA|nr:hypothetical protein [Stylosanthes scabra]